MGRELRRKQAKKEGKSLQKEEVEDKNLIRKLLIITFILVFIGSAIYLLSALFITKELDWINSDKSTKQSEAEENSNNVSNSILASAIFKQSEEDYYVYFYDFDNVDSDNDLENITSTVENALSNHKVYKVDTGSALNSKYVSDSSNKNAKTLSELKVVSPTLIKITGDTITEYYEKNEIISKLS